MDRKEYQRQYYLKNKAKFLCDKEKRKEYKKKYDITSNGKKSNSKRDWKKRGLDMDTFYYVYPIYLNATHCERCGVKFNAKSKQTIKCMDHCHSTGMFRNVICGRCNLNVIPNIKFNSISIINTA